MEHSKSNEYTAQILNPPTGGRGAKKYIKPRIEIIFLDNEISLALESTPPIGPEEGYNFNSNNPFMDQLHDSNLRV